MSKQRPTNRPQTRRNLLICRLYYRDGVEMPQIAARYGITKQRVFAILRRYGDAQALA